MLNAVRTLSSLLSMLAVAAATCAAQAPAAKAPDALASAPGIKLSADLARRVDVMIRSHSEIPPEYVISIGIPTKSEVPGYDQIGVSFSTAGHTSRPITFLLSEDGKTLAQFNKFDLSQAPKDKVPAPGRPGRGGAENAPVVIVGFDDLQCPFCAQMNASLFPAIQNRYKGQVRVVYLDFPLEIHPWAMRAAIDANCVAAESPDGYWNYVDYVHAHSGEIGGSEHSIAKANSELDQLAVDEGARQKINAAALAACIQKQDDATVKASLKEGEKLGVGATPALFINGEKVEGVTPIENIYRMIDEALTAAGQTPPPPVQPAAPAPAPPAAKPGN